MGAQVSSIVTGTNQNSWATFAQDLAADVNAVYVFVNGAGTSAYSAANPVVTVWVSDVTAEQIWVGPYNGAASNAVDIWRARGFTTGSARSIALQRQAASGYAPIAYTSFAIRSASTTTMDSGATGAATSVGTSAPSRLTLSSPAHAAGALFLTGVNTMAASVFSTECPIGDASYQSSVGTLADADSRKNNWGSDYTGVQVWTLDADSSGRFFSWAGVSVYSGGAAPAAPTGNPYYFLNQTRIGL